MALGSGRIVRTMKILDDKRKYLLSYYADADGIIGKILRWYWANRIAGMSEGEVLDRYYEVTGGAR